MKECYKTIKAYPNYEASNLGNIRNKKTGIIRKPTDRKGYYKIRLNNKDEQIHRLVADTFLGEPHDNLQINHKDGNKHNNRIDNLEWVTGSENIKHAYTTGLKQPSGGPPGVKIIDNVSGTVYDSIKECARNIGGTPQGVRYAVRHKGKYMGHLLQLSEEVID